MERMVRGSFVSLDGESFYKIENYDCMDDFFMTITSSSDVWNFCWAQGGISAGRRDADRAVFPYYTADKLSDTKGVTGSLTLIAVHDDGKTERTIWEPFAADGGTVTRNIYKNQNGTKVWFEEYSAALGISFRYGWTSSHQFGLVRMVNFENRSDHTIRLSVLDGCRNIMCASTEATFQNANSVLLDAYKQTDLDESNIALFSVSSVVTDKAEPSEGLYANTGWFTTDGTVLINPAAPREFVQSGVDISSIKKISVLKGKRPVFYIAKEIELDVGKSVRWYQIFDTALTAPDVILLKERIADRKAATRALEADIAACNKKMTQFIEDADGIQDTAETMTGVHHNANVMFNIMRGGVFADGGAINRADFLSFIAVRNKPLFTVAEAVISSLPQTPLLEPEAVKAAIEKTGNAQLIRLFMEYLPLTFSRRHGDPSRPWNKFSIRLEDDAGNPVLNYEGNWRDIFQNWEALAMSYPSYIANFTAKFLNAMTSEGFNPYRITRGGIDWEIPDPADPWAQYGYWGDHQVIYLQKLLELFYKLDPNGLCSLLKNKLFSSANVPYRLKSYAEISADPRNSIIFDEALSRRLLAESAVHGSDKKLVQDSDGQPALVSMATKLLQIVIAKAANLVPDGGIWMNTQRPEWNDANNALAGWGLSVVTTAYLYRMLSFLIPLFSENEDDVLFLPEAVAVCLSSLAELYTDYNAQPERTSRERKAFVDNAGFLFQTERESLYRFGYGSEQKALSRSEVVCALEQIRILVARTLRKNKRSDGLYHSYNTLRVQGDSMEVLPLQEMLEGQVAILSSGLLSASEALSVIASLKKSRLYEARQNSYLLYPNKELPRFLQKNQIPTTAEEEALLRKVAGQSGFRIVQEDIKGSWHFNADFTNVRVMREKIAALPEAVRPSTAEVQSLCELYEKTFCHQNFTGRSGTFYAYEGLGSIYWHMVSKLLLAVEENILGAQEKEPHLVPKLVEAYYDVRQGLGFNKTPALYGAFPFDPYSHTPYHQGAKQPGMTGQVKEEILTRWGELGVSIRNGCARFEPFFLKAEEWKADGTLRFSWCGVPVIYHRAEKESKTVLRVTHADGKTIEFEGSELPQGISRSLFFRDGSILQIDAWLSPSSVL